MSSHRWGTAPDFVGPRHELRERLLLDLLLAASPGPRILDAGAGGAEHHRRYARGELVEKVSASEFTVTRCLAWGFPVSALYHRHVYERYVGRQGPTQPRRCQRPALALLAALLQLDRLFVGVERGSLGYLLLARRL